MAEGPRQFREQYLGDDPSADPARPGDIRPVKTAQAFSREAEDAELARQAAEEAAETQAETQAEAEDAEQDPELEAFLSQGS